MMCAEVQELMLECDPDELVGSGDSAVAVHLRSCEVCRAAATLIVESTTNVRVAYGAATPTWQPARVRRRIDVRKAAWAVASLAAAAAIMLVVSGRPEVSTQHLTWRNVEPDTTGSLVAVEVPDGRNAIVFDTKNPLVSVVWIY